MDEYLKAGDKVVAKKRVEFTDQTVHEVGQVFTVTQETLAYFNCFYPKEYERSKDE